MEDTVGGYSMFFDLAYQTAWRRYNHRKFWNVVVHVVAAWFSAWPLVSLGTWIFPFFIQFLLIMLKLIICLVQDLKLGVIYSLTYILVANHALNAEVSFSQALIILVLSIGFQVGIGHYLIETEGPIILGKQLEGGVIFLAAYTMNDLFLAPFHFSILALMRANMLPDLQWRSDLQLKKLIEQLSGKKSP